jgi:hypothetical protein
MAQGGSRVPQKVEKSFGKDVYKAQGNALGSPADDPFER